MVSVCIATYNGEKYIKEEIDSILPQLTQEDEIIISDDGSTDSTLDILTAYHDDRIKIYSHTEKIANPKFRFDYTTHNFENAISKAQGDYIFLADQDDVWLPEKVKAMTKALQDNDIVISDCMVVDKDLNVKRNSRYTKHKPSYKVARNLISSNNQGCCIAFRREILDKVLPFPKYGVAQDFWIAVFGGLFYKVKFLSDPLILFRRHNDNLSTSLGKSTDNFTYKVKYRLYSLGSLIKRGGLRRVISNLY